MPPCTMVAILLAVGRLNQCHDGIAGPLHPRYHGASAGLTVALVQCPIHNMGKQYPHSKPAWAAHSSRAHRLASISPTPVRDEEA
jgi:hypothetical protein